MTCFNFLLILILAIYTIKQYHTYSVNIQNKY